MTFEEALRDYREPKYGCISNVKNPGDHSCDNALLFSATAFHIGEYAFGGFAHACEVAPGLFNRYPGETSQEGWDDLIGLASLNSVVAGDILRWGQANHWSWNNVDPFVWTFRTWLYRYPCFPAFLKVAAGVKPSIIEQLMFSFGCIVSALTPKGNTSGKCLQYLMNKTVMNKHTIPSIAIEIWHSLMRRKYPGGMRDVYAIYFGPTHPFTIYGPKDFI